MTTLGAELADVAAGRVSIALPIEPRLSQQDGYVHAGFVVAALDSACGYAEQGSERVHVATMLATMVRRRAA
jgi:acyl-coenzyme A thioesterase PaaI-like protein